MDTEMSAGDDFAWYAFGIPGLILFWNVLAWRIGLLSVSHYVFVSSFLGASAIALLRVRRAIRCARSCRWSLDGIRLDDRRLRWDVISASVIRDSPGFLLVIASTGSAVQHCVRLRPTRELSRQFHVLWPADLAIRDR